MNDYAGYHETPVLVVGETPTRYRVRGITLTRLAGRNRSLAPGETKLVPKHAIKSLETIECGLKDVFNHD